jgi:hypothetical protein
MEPAAMQQEAGDKEVQPKLTKKTVCTALRGKT